MKNTRNIETYFDDYRIWLNEVKHFRKKVISSRVSNIKVVAEHYDILREFAKDECAWIFDDLSFSKEDWTPGTSIVINGDYYNGLATYRYALKLFVEYLKQTNYTPAEEPCEEFMVSLAEPSVEVVAELSAIPSGTFIGSFAEFKRYIGPFSKNEVNRFCKKIRDGRRGQCEYCGQQSVLQSAHIVERPIIVRDLLEKYYKKGPDYYVVNLDEFFTKFESAHMPVEDHIFFLCKKCHDMLDIHKTITVADVFAKRKTGDKMERKC